MNEKTILIVLAVALVAIIIYYNYNRGDDNHLASKEGFLAAGAIDHIGTIVPDPVRIAHYEMLGDQEDPEASMISHSAGDFASMVNDGNHMIPETLTRSSMDRLDELSNSYFPTIASKALPFSQEAAKPLYHTHAVNLPKVSLKGKLYEMNLAEAVRGSVPINYDPNISVIGASRYSNEDSFNPGYMTQAFNGLHNKLTGAYKNMPVNFAGAGQASGIGGNAVEAIYDF